MINIHLPVKFGQNTENIALDPKQSLYKIDSETRRRRIGIKDFTPPSGEYINLAGAWLLNIMGYDKIYWYQNLWRDPDNAANVFSLIRCDSVPNLDDLRIPESMKALYIPTGYVHALGDNCIYLTGKAPEKVIKYILAHMKMRYPDLFERFKDDPTPEGVYRQFHDTVNKGTETVFEDKAEKLKTFFKDSLCQDKRDLINNLEGNIKSCRENIAAHIKNIVEKQETINEYIERINSLRKNRFDCNKSAEELIQFLADNEIIEDVQTYGSEHILFQFTADLEYEDLDEFEENVNYAEDIAEDYKDILITVACSDRFKIRATTQIILKKNDFKAYDYSNISATQFENAIPNPHLMGFNCFGNHYGSITAFMQNFDYINAISEMIEAGSVINTYDSTVVEKMAYYIDSNWDRKIVIDTETGELLTVEEAYEKLGTEK